MISLMKMIYDFEIRELREKDICFVSEVYTENIKELHGSEISLSEWQECFSCNTDCDEINFIIFANGEKAAWLKLNGFQNEKIYISMLVVSKKLQRMGVGSFAVGFAEEFAKERGKTSVLILTTADNIAAKNCYKKLGYTVVEYIRYAAGDGIERDGMVFQKWIV